MVDDSHSQEEPLDFSRPHHVCKCPYCGETVSAEEVEEYLAPGSNTFVCPNCRKKLHIDELGRGI